MSYLRVPLLAMMSLCSSCLLVMVLVAFRVTANLEPLSRPVAWPPTGPLRGRVETHSSSFAAFRGIPFGEPPVGGLRFFPPVPAAKWYERVEAMGPSTRCAGSTLSSSERAAVEDCLNLDLWAPISVLEQVLDHTGPSAAQLPVIVIFGDIGELVDPAEWTEASQLHSVLIRANHRQGVLGYMTHPELRAQHPAGAANAALLDQRLALEWVHQNVAYFGGDPQQITVLADGVAATEMLWQLTATDARMDAPQLFQHLLLHAPEAATVESATIPHAEEQAAALSVQVKCQTLHCLQRVPWPQLMRASRPASATTTFAHFQGWCGSLASRPVVDHVNWIDHPVHLLSEGRFDTTVTVVLGIGTSHRPSAPACTQKVAESLLESSFGSEEMGGFVAVQAYNGRRDRLLGFYKRHNKARVKQVDALLNKYSSDLSQLALQLTLKYPGAVERPLAEPDAAVEGVSVLDRAVHDALHVCSARAIALAIHHHSPSIHAYNSSTTTRQKLLKTGMPWLRKLVIGRDLSLRSHTSSHWTHYGGQQMTATFPEASCDRCELRMSKAAGDDHQCEMWSKLHSSTVARQVCDAAVIPEPIVEVVTKKLNQWFTWNDSRDGL